MRKKIMMLGGSQFQLEPIIYAKEQGHYVIVCDYLSDNPGQFFADEYHGISTTNVEAVLKLAEKLKIDGIVAYASDPAAPTAAYIAEKLVLPGNPYQSTLILTHKNLYREFLLKNKFNIPAFYSSDKLEEILACCNNLQFPFLIKPVDSSGSKGVSLITDKAQLQTAFPLAMSYSRCKRVIIEEFVSRNGYQIAGDGFIVNGRLVFRCFAQEHFSKYGNPFVPIGESFPLLISEHLVQKTHCEIQRLLSLLNMRTGALNFDIVIDKDERVFLMEIGPRNGGNFIPRVIQYATGIDLTKHTVYTALGLENASLTLPEQTLFHASYMIHSNRELIYQKTDIADEIQKNIIEMALFVKQGDSVPCFNGSNNTIGYAILRFHSGEEMLEKMNRIEDLIKVDG